MKVTLPQVSRQLDQQAETAYHIPTILLMERVALQLRSVLYSSIQLHGRVAILCGSGNNGGDGFALARMLHHDGVQVQVLQLSSPERYQGDCRTAYQMALACGVAMNTFDGEIGDVDVIVDAMLGTGLSKPVTDRYAQAVQAVNGHNARVLSVDIPTGIDGSTGRVMGVAVRADDTVTFATYKRGQLLFPGRDCCGAIHVVDIGIPPKLLNDLSEDVMDDRTATSILLKRTLNSHKGDYGHALVVAGSALYSGAGILCSNACVRSGPGLVTWMHPMTELQPAYPEVMQHSVDADDGQVLPQDVQIFAKMLEGKSALILGPGLGRGGGDAVMRSLPISLDIPVVIDADGLNAMSRMDQVTLPEQVILTPHPKEAARLLRTDVKAVVDDPVQAALRISNTYQAICVLKMATTIVADPAGRMTYNVAGCPGMAKGGSGDVLTGIIGGLAARGYAPYDAARMGVYLHARTGEAAAQCQGAEGMLPHDMIEQLGNVMMRLEQSISETNLRG